MASNHYKISKGITLNPQTSAPSNPVDGDIFYDDTLNKFRAYQNGAWTDLISSGSGGINYVSNPNFETDTTGWAAYADAAAATPVDGTGGSPNVTITRNTSSPLRDVADGLITKDAVNRQGQGVSYDFEIDDADFSKPLTISFDYNGSANFDHGDGTVVDPSDIMVYIYDVDNTTLIHPIVSGLDGSGRFVSSFQAAASGNSYRLILHIATTNATAWTFQFDNIIVGPSAVVSVDGPITDWKSFTPTGSWTTNSTYTGIYRRIGDTAEIHVNIALAGAPNSASLTINMPSGLTIDTTKILDTGGNDEPVGDAHLVDGGNQYIGRTGYSSTSSVFVTYDNPDDANNRTLSSNVTQAAPFTFGSGDSVSADFIVPISGWSSGKISAVATDSNRPVAARYSHQTFSIPDDTITILNATTKEHDTHGSVSGGVFTAPVSGYYNSCASLRTAGQIAWVAGEVFSLYFYKNNALVNILDDGEFETTTTQAVARQASIDVYLNAGETIDWRGYHNQGAAQNFIVQISFHKTDTGSALAALTENVNARYYASATAISGTLATISWTTKDFDSHNSMSSGTYTVSIKGEFKVHAELLLSGSCSS
jgi:hypothetical protein